MEVEGMPLSTYLDKQHFLQITLSLVKIRQAKNVSRAELARRMDVPVQRIHDFDERKTPWRSVGLAFMMLYARCLDVRISVGIEEVPRPESTGEPNEWSPEAQGGQPL